MKSIKTLALIVILAITGLTGCSAMQSEVGFDETNSFTKVDPDQIRCDLDPVEYDLYAHFIGFEIVSSNGGRFGAILGQFFKAFDVRFKLKKGEATLKMEARQTIAPTYNLSSVRGVGVFNENEGGVDVDFGQIGLGFDFYSKTSLSKLADRALENTLKNLNKDLQKVQRPWRTFVVEYDHKKKIAYLEVGSQAGLRVGDRLKISNGEHKWLSGHACRGVYHDFEPEDPAKPTAYATVRSVGPRSAGLEVQLTGLRQIDAGAIVQIDKLQGKNRQLNRAVRLREIATVKLVVVNQTINLLPYLEMQIEPQLQKAGFYLYKSQ